MADFTPILKAANSFYFAKMVDPADGRPLGSRDVDDLDNNGDKNETVTFSEGASYVLLRAALSGDRATFDKVWAWTKSHLQRCNISQVYDPIKKKWYSFPSGMKDHLFAWRHLPSAGGRSDGGVLWSLKTKLKDFFYAADADQDIAAALIIAHKKWGDPVIPTLESPYLADARAILKDVWEKETKVVAGKRILVGGENQTSTVDPFTGQSTVGVNPSYFRPTYYEGLFAEYDTEHNWKEMIAPAYEIIQKAGDATMHGEGGRPVEGRQNLSQDWVGVASAYDDNQKLSLGIHDHGWSLGDHRSADYFSGGDSFRTYFWMALQAKANPSDAFAQRYVTDHAGGIKDAGPLAFFLEVVRDTKSLYSAYEMDGRPHWQSETLPTLAVYAAYLAASGHQAEADILMQKVNASYDSAEGKWVKWQRDDNSKKQAEPKDFYYSQNWVWFALYLMQNGAGELK